VHPGGRRLLAAAIVTAALAVSSAGCSSSSSGGAGTAVIASLPDRPSGSVVGGATTASSGEPATGTGGAAVAAAPPDVALIPVAVRALEAKLGGPQQYFEINATSKLVNLFVALNNGAFAQNWLYVDGELTSKDPQPASGRAFVAASMAFDPATVLSKVGSDLAGSQLDLFLVEGGIDGAVRYTVVVSSSEGGQLLVVVRPDGKVIEVDPN
jgi:hypothetical protein